jgi:nitrogen-specific signal transduction histidine kinase
MENRIRQTQKMEAIGQLAGGVAHDFNNILTVIQGHAELGMMKINKEEAVYKDLSEIHRSGERAGNLTRQLLAFGRKQPMTLKVLDINEVITNLEKMVRRLIGEDIQIVINLAPGLPAINADPGQLEQILLNILINARDAINSSESDNERTINIDTQATTLDKDFVAHHPGSQVGPHVLIAISDTGVGMDDKVKSKIFDPFFTTKEPGKGTGLGLATVFGIVKQNKGSIYVVSEQSKGTIFTIYWPAVDQPIPKSKSRAELQKKMEGKESVLLVEDDEAVRQFTSEILKNLGYRVEQAAHGEAAIYLIEEKGFKPDLIITDIIMPKMNGRELAENIKEKLPKTKILLMSGYSDNQISLNGKLDKDFHFIAKPFSINKFAKKIRDVLQK